MVACGRKDGFLTHPNQCLCPAISFPRKPLLEISFPFISCVYWGISQLQLPLLSPPSTVCLFPCHPLSLAVVVNRASDCQPGACAVNPLHEHSRIVRRALPAAQKQLWALAQVKQKVVLLAIRMELYRSITWHILATLLTPALDPVLDSTSPWYPAHCAPW